MSVTSGATTESSPSTSLGIPLVQISHGISADTGTSAIIGSVGKSNWLNCFIKLSTKETRKLVMVPAIYMQE